MVYLDKSVGIAGFGLDEQDLFQSATDLHARPIRETSLKSGKTVSYFVPQSKLEGLDPYRYLFLLWTLNGLMVNQGSCSGNSKL